MHLRKKEELLNRAESGKGSGKKRKKGTGGSE